jgi:ubiquinone/menaquinone biosynthesis C-methylase UbiE
MSNKKIFVFDDQWDDLREHFEKVREPVRRVLGMPVEFEGLKYSPTNGPRDSQIRKGIDSVLGVNDGDISTSAILLDVIFDHSEGDYHCFDYLPGHPIKNQTLIDELVGSGLPTIILSQSEALEHVHTAGREQLAWLSKDLLAKDPEVFGQDLGRQLKKEFNQLRYNKVTLEVVNQFAKLYDKEELSSLATRVVLLWENERILTALKEAARRLNYPLRVLDIGCGTGRFEELLLCHSDTRVCVEQIVAIDFAPQFLVCARERLFALGLEEELKKKVVFMRRIAEDLRLPSEEFDVVLISFGVPCFTRYRKSIPEAARVLRSNGLMVLTGYNYDSLNFEYEETSSQVATGQRRSFFCANIDRKNNMMTLPGLSPFQCFTFTPSYFVEIVRQDLFVPDEEAHRKAIGFAPVETFPVLHGCAPREFIERLVRRGEKVTKSLPTPVSYMPEALEGYSDFSRDLYMMDRELCRLSSLRERGHYINIIASKK